MTLKKDFIDQLKQNKVLLGAALTWYSVKGSGHALLSLWLIRKPFFAALQNNLYGGSGLDAEGFEKPQKGGI